MRKDGHRHVGPERVLAWLARILAVLTAPFVRYELRGGACARDLKVGVIAANHRSMFDVVAGLICLHRFGHYPRLLIERKYVERGFVGWCARAIGAIPVDRDGDRTAALGAAYTALERGVPILVMPEGRLHWDPQDPVSTGPAKTGVSRLACDRVPVVPAALAGTEVVMPAGARVPHLVPLRRKVVRCNVADEPLWLQGEDHRANTELVMKEIRALLADIS